MRKLSHLPIYFLSGLLLSGCVTHQDLVNFNQGPEFPAQAQAIVNQAVLHIEPGDELGIFISVQNLNAEAALPFNLPVQEGTPATTQRGYPVDRLGNIDMPVLGTVPVAGKTLEELKQDLLARLESYLVDPIVQVRFLNLKVTVLGEVNRPGPVVIGGENLTLLEALGMAGDVNNYANRERVLIIREQSGQREYGYVNLHDRNLFASPYFYLRQNDVIYVEPLKARIASVSDPVTKALPWVGLGTTILNLIVIIAINTR